MSERDDGGPAFPTPGFESRGEGLSLRDWFAGQAIKHMRYHGMHVADPEIERAAAQAYRLADAMLAERAKRTT